MKHLRYFVIGLALLLALAFFAAGPGFIAAWVETFGLGTLLLLPGAWGLGGLICSAIGERERADVG